MVYPKFIIEDDSLIISKCTYHHQLVVDKEKVKGGGWFRIKDDVMTFHGDSHDFGVAKYEDIKNAIQSKKVFSSPTQSRCIADTYKFRYDTGSEIIDIE